MNLKPLNSMVDYIESFFVDDYVIIAAFVGAILVLVGAFK